MSVLSATLRAVSLAATTLYSRTHNFKLCWIRIACQGGLLALHEFAAAVLKNMAVHELALAVTYYGVTAETIASVDGNKDFSVCETRNVSMFYISSSLAACVQRSRRV